MSQPAIQYTGPKISDAVPWEIRQHLQLFYQKLGNHTQAMQTLASTVARTGAGFARAASRAAPESKAAVLQGHSISFMAHVSSRN